LLETQFWTFWLGVSAEGNVKARFKRTVDPKMKTELV
jgi:hypothetical protein